MKQFRVSSQLEALKEIIIFQKAIKQILQNGDLRGNFGICNDAYLHGSSKAYEIMYDLMLQLHIDGGECNMNSHRILFCLFLTEVSPTELLEMVQS
jgi:hypothetical protein